jgi:hypothetical protein
VKVGADEQLESDKREDGQASPEEDGGEHAHGAVSLRRVRQVGLLAASMRSDAAASHAAAIAWSSNSLAMRARWMYSASRFAIWVGVMVMRRLTAAQSPRPHRLTRKSVKFICVIQREKLDWLARLTARKGGTAGKFFRQVYFRRMILFC